jgi:hypothetical protein
LREVVLTACDRTFVVRGGDDVCALVETVFGGLIAGGVPRAPLRRYDVTAAARGFRLSDGRETRTCRTPSSLIFALDEDIILSLQHDRRDLFFLHAGVVGHHGGAVALAAAPGTGKSTLTLAALAHGLEYFSDELAPVDLDRNVVAPYPRALTLKSPPPLPYECPPGTRQVGTRFHVPLHAMPRVASAPAALRACLFLRRGPMVRSSLRALTTASAVAHLIENALNPLAHGGDGLDAAVRLARAVPCWELDSTDLRAAGEVVARLLFCSP